MSCNNSSSPPNESLVNTSSSIITPNFRSEALISVETENEVNQNFFLLPHSPSAKMFFKKALNFEDGEYTYKWNAL